MAIETRSIEPVEQETLLGLARRALTAAAGGGPIPSAGDAQLTDEIRAPHAAFVTLTVRGELRGCIGRLDPGRPLWKNVVDAAVGAAVGDPRFPAVRPDDVDHIRLEISVLGPAVEIADPDRFEPGVHGIIVEQGPSRGLLLPQVAQEHGWGRRQMLEAASWKAGLPRDAWRDPATRLLVFTASVFAEPERDSTP